MKKLKYSYVGYYFSSIYDLARSMSLNLRGNESHDYKGKRK